MNEADTATTARFDELFHDNVADVAAYCRWRTRSPADAEDALGEVFLTAWRRLDDVPAPASDARVWLYATARRVTANQHRAARRRISSRRYSGDCAAASAITYQLSHSSQPPTFSS